jgi:hypothetical protein
MDKLLKKSLKVSETCNPQININGMEEKDLSSYYF